MRRGETAKRICIQGRGTPHIFVSGNNWGGEKTYILEGGDTTHTMLMEVTIGVVTLHNIERTK